MDEEARPRTQGSLARQDPRRSDRKAYKTHARCAAPESARTGPTVRTSSVARRNDPTIPSRPHLTKTQEPLHPATRTNSRLAPSSRAQSRTSLFLAQLSYSRGNNRYRGDNVRLVLMSLANSCASGILLNITLGTLQSRLRPRRRKTEAPQ